MFLFAIEEHAHEIGLMDFFTNNAFNWVLLLVFLYWLGAKFLPPILLQRKESIESAIANARKTREEGVKFLEDQKAKVANADKEAEEIIVEARQIAEQMKTQSAEQTKKDIEQMSVKFEHAIHNERQMVITELRTASVKAAMQLAEAQLEQTVTPAVKTKLLNQFIGELDTVAAGERLSASHFSSSSKGI